KAARSYTALIAAENGLSFTMLPSKNDVLAGSIPARACSLKLVSINRVRSDQLDCRCSSRPSRSPNCVGGNTPGKDDVARAASANPGRLPSSRSETEVPSDQRQNRNDQSKLCSRSWMTVGVLTSRRRG